MAGWVICNMFEVMNEVPLYHVCVEVFLLLLVLWLILHKSSNPNNPAQLTMQECDDMIHEWVPEPLVTEIPISHRALRPYVVTSKAGKYVDINGKTCLNLATHNYLNFIGNEEIEKAAIKTIKTYGVGSCGPRGFYGTVDVHLDLENKLAEFMSLEEAVVYSYGFSTIASAIPAYAKRGDVVFVDQCVNFSIQKGLNASRSRIRYFKHNDAVDLERLLTEQEDIDFLNPKKARVTRRFLILEGIYMNTGTICPLPAFVALRKKYKLRLFLDESVSFGSLGKYGRGVTEYYNVNKNDVDMIMCGLECGMGTIGGFCIGSSYIVEHQRLSGLGYCFSASLPPLLAAAAIKGLELMVHNPSIFTRLQRSCEYLHYALKTVSALNLNSDKLSPVKHLSLNQSTTFRIPRDMVLLTISDMCIDQGIGIIGAESLEDNEVFKPLKTLRVTVNSQLSLGDCATVAAVLKRACNKLTECDSAA